MSFITTPEGRAHVALGALNELGFRIAMDTSRALDADRFNVLTDRTFGTIQRQRDLLNELELALMALKAEREAVQGQAA